MHMNSHKQNLEENKGTDESFGCFNSQVLADRVDVSEFM